MDANYIYNIFETATKSDLPLDIALANHSCANPLPEGMDKKATMDFINLHYDPLWRAYQTGNRKLFADILAVCEKGNEHEIDALERAYATGNEKLIAEYEARYGQSV